MAAPASEPPIAIVSALPLELAAARAALEGRERIEKDGLALVVGRVPAGRDRPPRRAIAAVLGMGQRPVERGLEALFRGEAPAAVALIGLSGGCSPEARAGDLYCPSPMRIEPELGPNERPIEGREPLEPARPVVDAIFRAAAAARRHVKIAPGITVNVQATPGAKESLGRNRGVALCDMETFWAARACARAHVPFAALRVIYDGLLDPLPEVPGLGKDPLWRVLLRRPAAAPRLPALALRLLKARRALDPVVRNLWNELALL